MDTDPNEMAASFYAVYRELGRLESAGFCMGDQ
jgi:hypothetical protein